MILDPTKDVFVKYFAPWCNHSKKFASVWEDLANLVYGSEDLIIAKYDHTANEVEGLKKIIHYPALILYTKDNKEGI